MYYKQNCRGMSLTLYNNVIVYFKHGLGNLIMFTPTLRAIASMSKKMDICFASSWRDSRRSAFDNFVENCPFVNKVINYPKDSISGYDLYVHTKHSESSEAFKYFESKSTINIPMVDWRNSYVHEVYWYFNHAVALGYSGKMPRQYVPINASKILDKTKKNIGICNGTYSIGMRGAKQWPHFRALVDELKENDSIRIVKLGYLDELEDVPGDINFVNKLKFSETCGVLAELDYIICNDTAIMHAADALNIKGLALFGGSLVSKNCPINGSIRVLRAGLPCQPCQRTPAFYACPHAHACMSGLSVETVLAEVYHDIN